MNGFSVRLETKPQKNEEVYPYIYCIITSREQSNVSTGKKR